MAFVLPTFPIVCNIFNKGTYPAGPPRIANQPCQLRAPTPSAVAAFIPVASQTVTMTLLLPALTDIRDPINAPTNSEDWVECPAGSGRVYVAIRVDDIAKGFSNEHRYCILSKVFGLPWPTPTP